MLREIQGNENVVNTAMYKCGETVVYTGMGVVINEATGEFEFPTTDTGEEVWFVDKELEVHGINAVKANISAFDDDYNKVVENGRAVLKKEPIGALVGTDQYDASLVAGDKVVAGTDGKWKKGASSVDTRYEFVKTYIDNGRTLAKIRVLDTPAHNA